jgi:F-type H+-transporting ATPase subunit delta
MSRRFARPYAKALLETAGTTERAVAARGELARFVEAAQRVPAVKKMAMNPAVPRRVKDEVLREINRRLEIGPLVGSLLELLQRNYRLAHVDAVLEAIDDVLDRRLGVVSASVTAAHALTAEQVERLRAALESMLEQRVKLKVELDPTLLGGFVARIGSRRYDASLDGQIQRLATTLAEGGQ